MQDTGSGAAVLILHGMPGARVRLAPLVDALRFMRRVLIPDLPGYGASPQLEGRYDLRRVMTLIEDALMARGVCEASVVGISAGGYRALTLALSGRIRIERLVLLGAMAGFGEQGRTHYRGAGQLVRGLTRAELEGALLARGIGAAYRAGHPVEAAAEVSAAVAATSPEVLAAELEALAEAEDLRPRLREITIPMLVRIGTEDASVPPEWGEEIARLAPGAELQLVPGCGHSLLLEDREDTLSATVRFLGV